MTKTKIRLGAVLFVILILSVGTPLSAKDDTIKLFLNLTTGNFSAFVVGGGAEIKVYKFFSVKPSVDLPTTGGRILYLDGVLRPKSSGRIKPYLSFGYLDYFFKGNDRYDSDEVKGFTFGGGLDFHTKKGKYNSSLGVKFGRAEDTGFVLFYLNLGLVTF
jgi:hypothetical protein